MVRAKLVVLLGLFALAGCGAGSPNSTPVARSAEVRESTAASLLKPSGQGPFPALVILHDCSGLGSRSSGAARRWAKEMVSRGYVIVIPDSFSPRGHAGGVCTNPSPSREDVSPTRRAEDAYTALAYLRSLPFVDGSRVGLMGGSHGGSSTLASMVAAEASRISQAQGAPRGFAAAVALYPSCAVRYGSWRPVLQKGGSRNYLGVYEVNAPLLILIGELDDWTPMEPCQRLAEVAEQAGFPVSIKVYPGAHHAFDSNASVNFNPERVNVNSPTGRGATVGGDPKAWADSIREVDRFFALHLK
jgi:dienelactone hydrolase